MTLKQVRTDVAAVIADGLEIRCEPYWSGTFGPNEAQVRWGGNGDWLTRDGSSFCETDVVLSVMLAANKQDLRGAQEWLETKVSELWALTGTALPTAGGQFPRCAAASPPSELYRVDNQPSGLLGVLVTFYPIPHEI